jgi:hypothetical protein
MRTWLRIREQAGLDGVRIHDYADFCVMPTWWQRPLSDRVFALEMSA